MDALAFEPLALLRMRNFGRDTRHFRLLHFFQFFRQSFKGDFAVLYLRAALRCLDFHARRLVSEPHPAFHLVAVLPARPGSAYKLYVCIALQTFPIYWVNLLFHSLTLAYYKTIDNIKAYAIMCTIVISQ